MISAYVWRNVLLRSQAIKITIKTFSCSSISKSAKKPPKGTTTERETDKESSDTNATTKEPDEFKYDASQSLMKKGAMETQIAELDKVLKFYVKEKTEMNETKNVKFHGFERILDEYKRGIEAQFERSIRKHKKTEEIEHPKSQERKHSRQQNSRRESTASQQWENSEKTLDSSLEEKKKHREDGIMYGLERMLQLHNRIEDMQTKRRDELGRNADTFPKQHNKKKHKIIRMEGLESLLRSGDIKETIQTRQRDLFENSRNPLENEKKNNDKPITLQSLKSLLHEDYSIEEAEEKRETRSKNLDPSSEGKQRKVERDTKLLGLKRVSRRRNTEENIENVQSKNVHSVVIEKMNVGKGFKLLGLERLTENYQEEEKSETQQWKKKSASQEKKQQIKDPNEQMPETLREIFQLFDESKFKEKIKSYQPNVDLPSMGVWKTLHNMELQQKITVSPSSALEEVMMWTEEGKMWRFPIDNEQGMEDEQNVHFSKHIFLDQHLEGWCPTEGPIRHFMELVCIGLSKNPYLSVEEKTGYIIWYKNYFKERVPLLDNLGIWEEGSISLSEPKES